MSSTSDGDHTSQSINIFSIPWDDVLVPYVGPALSIKDCFNLRCVSKSGKLLGDSILKKVYKLILYSTLTHNLHAVQVLRRFCTDVYVLTVAPENEYHDVSDTISAENFTLLTSGLKKLSHVNLAYCSNLSPRAVHHIFVNSKNLTFIDLTRCCWLTDGALQTLTVHQKHLRHVNLRCCCQLSARSLIKLIALCPYLEKLSLQQISSVDDSVLAAILHHSEHLISLNLLMCKEISPGAIERFLTLRPSVKVKQFGCRSLMCLQPGNFTFMNNYNEGGTGRGLNVQMPLGLGFY